MAEAVHPSSLSSVRVLVSTSEVVKVTAKLRKGFVAGGSCVMTKNDQFFVKALV